MERRSGQRNILDYLENMDLLSQWLHDNVYLIELSRDEIIDIRGFPIDHKKRYYGHEALNILKQIAQEEYVYECRLIEDCKNAKAKEEEHKEEGITGRGVYEFPNYTLFG
jgi:hypothetical protein